jgi:hypothetical protein
VTKQKHLKYKVIVLSVHLLRFIRIGQSISRMCQYCYLIIWLKDSTLMVN